MRGDGRLAKKPKQTLSRLLSYMLKYRGTLIVVGLCVVFSAVAQAASSASLGTLVDDYITPMLGQVSPDFGPLFRFLTMMACIYLVGMVSSFLCNFLMVKVSQGTQKTIRDEMFAKMQRLPLRYFDTNTAGNIMSRYTSDIDTLRQMVSQSIPQAASSIITLVVVFARMLSTSLLRVWAMALITMQTTTAIRLTAYFFI